MDCTRRGSGESLSNERLSRDSQQIWRRGIKRKGFEHLLRRLFRRWMSCNVEVDDTSSIVCEHNKNEKDFEPNGVDGEEVDGRELRNVILGNVRHVCDGSFGRRTMYLATEASRKS
jgi:hypothetical protein